MTNTHSFCSLQCGCDLYVSLKEREHCCPCICVSIRAEPSAPGSPLRPRWVRAFSSCGERGRVSCAVWAPRGGFCCTAQAAEFRAVRSRGAWGSAALRHMGSSPTRGGTCVPCKRTHCILRDCPCSRRHPGDAVESQEKRTLSRTERDS